MLETAGGRISAAAFPFPSRQRAHTRITAMVADSCGFSQVQIALYRSFTVCARDRNTVMRVNLWRDQPVTRGADNG